MDILYKLVSSPLSYALPFLFVLSLVVFFHELGHFIVARWCGVRVLVFSIGFGPELFGFNDKTGTRWKISAIPLGGYVKFFGDENAASVPDATALASMDPSERQYSFFHKPVSARSAVVAAGPIANFLLAIVLIAGIALVYGERAAIIMPDLSPRIDEVVPDSPAARAHFQPGDIVRSINGHKINFFADMQRIVTGGGGQPLDVVVDRNGGSLTLNVTPAENPDKKGAFILGVKHSAIASEDKTDGPVAAVWFATKQTWSVISNTLLNIGGIVTFRESADQLGGPIEIAKISHEAATQGFVELLRLAAFLSTSVGLLNLFPIPVLDGGHLLFYGIESIRGRPLPVRAQEVGFGIGLAIVVTLMISVTANDFVKNNILGYFLRLFS
jgi:regulator of sigma E protease